MPTAATLPTLTPVALTTTVVELFIHGPRPSQLGDTAPTPMIAVTNVEAVTGMGLREDERYFQGIRRNGKESRRQVSLIDEATIQRHEQTFGPIAHDVVKSQLVLAGDIRLPDLLGCHLTFGTGDDAAVLELTIKRDPCEAMDLITTGLREAMKDGEQGALARVVRDGIIRVGQTVTISSVSL